MNKTLLALLLTLLCGLSMAAGRIQNEDVKSEAELISLGATKTSLINASKIYVLEFDKTLEDAIDDGDLSGGGGSGDAIDVAYDNASSGLLGTNLQDTTDELDGRLDDAELDLSDLRSDFDLHEAATAAHGATGAVVGTTNSQTLTNKTLTSPVINGTVSGDAFLDEDNLASNSATKMASQQSIKAYQDNINFNLLKTDDSNFEVTIGSWAVYNDGGAYVDGTGGTPTATAVRSTSDPLNGSGSLLISTVNAVPAHGASVDFVMPLKWRQAGLPISVCFPYVTVDNSSTQYFEMIVYDKDTSSIVLQQAIPVDSDGGVYCNTFTSNATTDDYRLSINEIGPGGSGVFSIKIDDVVITEADLEEINQTGFVGSLTWADTTNCQWTKSTSVYGVYADDADCDNLVRTTRGSVGDPTLGLKPHVSILDAKVNGRYRVVYSGAAIKQTTTTNTCLYKLVYETSTSTGAVAVAGTASQVAVPHLIFEDVKFTSAGSKTLDLQVSSTNNSTACDLTSSGANLKISVEFIPDEIATVFGQQTTLTRANKNQLVANINCSATSSITRDDDDFLASVGNISTGKCTVNFESGVFNSIPTCHAGVKDDTTNLVSLTISSETTTSAVIECLNNSGSTACTAINAKLVCDKTGDDVNKHLRLLGTFNGSQIRDGEEMFMRWFASTNTVQNCMATTATRVEFEDEFLDSDNALDAATGTLTIPANISYCCFQAAVQSADDPSGAAGEEHHLQLFMGGVYNRDISIRELDDPNTTSASDAQGRMVCKPVIEGEVYDIRGDGPRTLTTDGSSARNYFTGFCLRSN
jgi:hypothetical protein